MRLPIAVGTPHAKALVKTLCFAAATLSMHAAAEGDPCERDADVDAQMACYVARFCTDVDTDAARADCYSKVIRTLLAVPTTAPPTTVPEPSAETPPSASVGQREQPNDEIPQELRAHVTTIVPRAHGLRFIRLDNTQVWEEIERSRSRLETGDVVRIVRRFNSYRLYPPNGGMIRVRRLVCDAHADENTLAKCRSVQRADG